MMLDWNTYSRPTGSRAHETVIDIGKLKNTNPQVLIKFQQNWLMWGVGQFALRHIHLWIPFEKRRNCVSSGRSRSLGVTKAHWVVIKAYPFVHYVQNFIQHPSVKVNSIRRGNYWGIVSLNFDVTVQLLIIYSSFVKYLEEQGTTMKQCISYLLTSRRHMIQLGWRCCIIFSLSLVSPWNW
jgi:hypothetical protein